MLSAACAWSDMQAQLLGLRKPFMSYSVQVCGKSFLFADCLVVPTLLLPALPSSKVNMVHVPGKYLTLSHWFNQHDSTRWLPLTGLLWLYNCAWFECSMFPSTFKLISWQWVYSIVNIQCCFFSSTESGSFYFLTRCSTQCIACLNMPTRVTTAFRSIQVTMMVLNLPMESFHVFSIVLYPKGLIQTILIFTRSCQLTTKLKLTINLSILYFENLKHFLGFLL